MGMGVDVHGRDATKAAKRAVSDAIRHSSLGFFRMIDKTANDMFVDVTGDAPYAFTYAGMIAHVLTYAAHRRTIVVTLIGE
jgi:uncharacterized protein (TIGR02058 family)